MQLKYELKDDLKEGLYTEWYINGTKKKQGRYNLDFKSGNWIYWDEKGSKQAEGKYKENIKNMYCVYSNKPIGNFMEVYDEYYTNKVGKWTYPNGNLIIEEYFDDNGKLIDKKHIVQYTDTFGVPVPEGYVPELQIDEKTLIKILGPTNNDNE